MMEDYNLVNAAREFSSNADQIAAFKWLESQIDETVLDKFFARYQGLTIEPSLFQEYWKSAHYKDID
jgi:hypothetical protein